MKKDMSSENQSFTSPRTCDKLLAAKIDDMVARAPKGVLSYSHFLTPGEVLDAKYYLAYSKCPQEYLFLGGYDGAERKMLVILPDYIEKEYLDTDELFRAVYIKKSGYNELDHRSYLGALMNLSLKRELLGDILVLPDGALVFATLSASKMLVEGDLPLERVGRDKVSVFYADKNDINGYTRTYKSESAIMASLRLDCAVASLCALSRSSAKEKIEHGLVRLNYREETSPSAEIREGDVLSVRTFGKFIIDGVSGETRSGRLKVDVRRYT